MAESGAHPREKLQAIFWPESDTQRAQSALRTTLMRIKRGLPGVDEPMPIEADRVGFNASIPATLDLERLSQLPSTPTSDQAGLADLAQFQHAVEAARGSFLEAFSRPDSPDFNQWVIVQHNFWLVRLIQDCDGLSDQQLEMRDIQPAIETVNRWLSLDPLNENAHHCLMRLHLLNGDRSSAWQA